MAENRRDQNLRLYRFSRSQLVILAVGFVFTSLVVFALGILIGQRIEERKLAQKEGPLAKIPVQPFPADAGEREGASTREEMTFYDALARVPSPVPDASEKSPDAGITKERAAKKKAAPLEDARGNVQGPPPPAVPQGPWTVQVNAFRLEPDAQNLRQRLARKGYDAYVVAAEVRGGTWYRVRIGRFATREEAKSLQEELKVKEKLTRAITVSR